MKPTGKLKKKKNPEKNKKQKKRIRALLINMMGGKKHL